MKKNTLIISLILLSTLSSCVYSLFPIYTEDTIVFKDELLGKWKIDNEGSFMLFEQVGVEATVRTEDEYKYSIEIKEGLKMESNDPIFIEHNGRKVYDEDSIRMIMRERLNSVNSASEESTAEPNASKKGKMKVNDDEVLEYEGSITVFEEMSYHLTIVDKKEEVAEEYTAHLVDIGGDLFMDLYPIKEFSSNHLSDNYFPVHTFYKVSVNDKKFTMTPFDLDKLNKLFESNLIRLRHETVEGTVLITAQPKELQKFIDRYSDDESVFDKTEVYSRLL